MSANPSAKDDRVELVDIIMNAASEVGAMRGRFLDTVSSGDVLLHDLKKVTARLQAVEWPTALEPYRDARLRDLDTMMRRVPARQKALDHAADTLRVLAPPGLPSSLLEDPDLRPLFLDEPSD